VGKTDTVTTSRMTVTAVQAVPGTSRTGLLRYAGSVEQASEHAVAAAVTASLTPAGGFAALPGPACFFGAPASTSLTRPATDSMNVTPYWFFRVEKS